MGGAGQSDGGKWRQLYLDNNEKMFSGIKKKMKTVSNRVAINTYLSTIESRKLSKQEEQRQSHGHRGF